MIHDHERELLKTFQAFSKTLDTGDLAAAKKAHVELSKAEKELVVRDASKRQDYKDVSKAISDSGRALRANNLGAARFAVSGISKDYAAEQRMHEERLRSAASREAMPNQNLHIDPKHKFGTVDGPASADPYKNLFAAVA
ncbi:MAG: hypothetical protein RLZZ399_2367 [Verrucomicrobiota bacterium]|jgi:choline kinase